MATDSLREPKFPFCDEVNHVSWISKAVAIEDGLIHIMDVNANAVLYS